MITLLFLLASALGLLAIVAVWAVFISSSPSRAQTPVPWVIGDVFVAINDGKYQVYDANGDPKGTPIAQNWSGYDNGCAFDTNQDLYTTNFSNAKVVKFSGIDPHGILQTIDTSAQGGRSTESIVFMANGDFLVGHSTRLGGNGDVQRFNPSATPVATYDLLMTCPSAPTARTG